MASEKTSAHDIQQHFEQAGFTVTSDASARLRVTKSGCVAYLESQDGTWVVYGAPYLVVHGKECELEDQGYQKFWLAKAEGKRFPIRRVELENFHRFVEEVRYLLGLKNLYHLSLGSTNARTVYDRVEGRPDR